VWCGGGHGGLGGCGGFGGCGGLGHGGLGHGGCGGFGVGFVTGGTTTGGTTTGGTTTGGTTTGGTTTGGTTTVTGGTVTGGTVTGGTVTGSGKSMVVTGFEPVGGFFVPVPGSGDCGDPDADGGVPARVVGAGVGVRAGLDGVLTVFGAGLTDGVGVLVGECSLGTTISGLPPPVWGVEPKYEPATG